MVITPDAMVTENGELPSMPRGRCDFEKNILSRSHKLTDSDPAGTLDSCYEKK